ncbi:MAG: hypothetical protein J6O62_03860 [Bacilli bacterium]|nr:hypothetical protein [Bacilli bacterium]MBO6194803.1 hypothetical protein [Bacilli bacterium]
MRRILKVLLVTIFIVVLTGCSKKIDKLSYTDYNEYFSNKEGYSVIDDTNKYDIDVRRYLEAGNGDIQVFYLEFSNEKNANKYIKDNYKKLKKKEYKNYTYIKDTKNKYMKLYKVKNVIVIGNTNENKNKRLLNKTLKELGF